MCRTNASGVSVFVDAITVRGPEASAARARVVSRRHRGGRANSRPGNQRPHYDHVPGCTYCTPGIGGVGLIEQEARERGHDVRTGTFSFGVLGRAKMAGKPDGFVKILADKTCDEMLDVHIIGLRSMELVAEATLALCLESTVEAPIRTIHARLTMSDAIGEAARVAHPAAMCSHA